MISYTSAGAFKQPITSPITLLSPGRRVAVIGGSFFVGMKNLVSKTKTAVAFQSGNRFKFPDDETVYEFGYIEYRNKEPVVRYYDENGNSREKIGHHLSDLIRA